MNSYRQLRQPIPQVLAALTLLFIGLSSVSYLQGVTIYATPIYLIITTTIELMIIILSFLGLFFKPHKTSINSWRFYFVLTVSTCYSIIFSLYNTYFFVALQTDHYLDKYWYYGFVFMAFFSYVIL
ncbi:DUF5079 family protein [Staphylococcus pettenkoferi]|uniref:DUF5079 family protein n=1 Tax=Staphylococcus pettenkoferi TaxID=170573 RepID=UPI00398C2E2A